jgi:hypothetical protein
VLSCVVVVTTPCEVVVLESDLATSGVQATQAAPVTAAEQKGAPMKSLRISTKRVYQCDP